MRGARWLGRGSAAVIGASLVIGVAAALVGGPLSAAGAGPGGLSGIPLLILTAAVVGGMVLGLPAAWRRNAVAAGVLVGGPIAVWIAFQLVAHAIDPCATGAWTRATTIAGTAACEDVGDFGLSIDRRWHLLLHAAVAAPVAAAFWIACERVGRGTAAADA